MIFYKSNAKSEALRQALTDPQWDETEKKVLAEVLRCVEVKEENERTMTTEAWVNNPTDLPSCPPHVKRGKWVNGQETYTCRGQKYMVEFAGTGYRIGRCW